MSSSGLVSGGTLVGLSIDDYCKEHSAVWVHLERPASEGVLAGTVAELYGCDGPFGTWQGVLRSGGLALEGFTVDFADIPVSFAFAGTGSQTVHTTVTGNVPTPVGNYALTTELDIGIDETGSTMSIAGTGTATGPVAGATALLGDQGSALPIEPAPQGSCG